MSRYNAFSRWALPPVVVEDVALVRWSASPADHLQPVQVQPNNHSHRHSIPDCTCTPNSHAFRYSHKRHYHHNLLAHSKLDLEKLNNIFINFCIYLSLKLVVGEHPVEIVDVVLVLKRKYNL